jgi:CheY-like chemotaxis protein
MADTKKPLVLIADDDEKLRGILRMKLESIGFEVAEAGNGQEAVAAARHREPAVIVLDVRMPVLSGTEAVAQLKQDSRLQNVPVLFLSAFGEEDAAQAWMDQKVAKELGAVDYIKKTSSLADIVAKINELAHA